MAKAMRKSFLERVSDFFRGRWARAPGDGEAAPVLRISSALVVSGLACVALKWNQPAPVLWAFACLSSGALVGFLFGIPRTVQASDPEGWGYRQQVNTNLEQISDWLTKIIIGLGLVQLKAIPGLLWQAGFRVAASVGDAPTDVSTGIALVLFFGVLGFFVGYLLTRLYLAGAFSRADRAAAGFDQMVSALESKVSLSEREGAPPLAADESKADAGSRGEVSLRTYSDEFERIAATGIPAREKIVLIGVLLERLVLEVAESRDISPPANRRASAVAMARRLAQEGRISGEDAAAFRDFWQVRNEAVHGRFELSEDHAARVLDVAWRLVRVLA